MAGYDESMSLARETGQTTDLATSLAGSAWLQARMGRAEQCQANADEALALAENHGITLAKLWALFALGDLHLATGDAPAPPTGSSGCRPRCTKSISSTSISRPDPNSPKRSCATATCRLGRDRA